MALPWWQHHKHCLGYYYYYRVRSRVSASFQQKYPPGSVLRCPTAAENGGMTRGGWPPSSPAYMYNVEPVTNTSSSSCANNGRRTPRWVLDACRRSLRLFLHFATRMVDNIDLYAAKPDVRPKSRFLPTPPAFDAPVRGVPVGMSPPRLVRKY